MFKKATLVLYALAMGALIFWQVSARPHALVSEGEPMRMDLVRGPLTVLKFPTKTEETKAVILFGSGDGGWTFLEEAVCHELQNHGYEVIGIDSQAYAQTDYNLAILQSDFSRMATTAETDLEDGPAPVIVGGYSMGAAQAIAVAGGPHPPAGLVGVLLMDPCARGRYGLRVSDQLDVLPIGPGTFSMEEFSHTMGKVRVAQWHAGQDQIDSRAWLNALTAEHREFDFAPANHFYNVDRDNFLRQLMASVEWILEPASPGWRTGENGASQP